MFVELFAIKADQGSPSPLQPVIFHVRTYLVEDREADLIPVTTAQAVNPCLEHEDRLGDLRDDVSVDMFIEHPGDRLVDLSDGGPAGSSPWPEACVGAGELDDGTEPQLGGRMGVIFFATESAVESLTGFVQESRHVHA